MITLFYCLLTGVLNNGSITNELWRYNIDSSSWEKLANSPLAVSDHVMVIVDNRWIFIHGGHANATPDSPISDMYIFDTKDGVWRKETYLAGGYK